MASGQNLKERYWKFLFDNLQRAVDELYATCEQDESILQCKEVAMVLERCSKDFYALIERFKLLQNFEQAETNNKPSSLAWEVRPSVPMPKTSEFSPRRTASRLSKRTLFAVSCPPASDDNMPSVLAKPLEIHVSNEFGTIGVGENEANQKQCIDDSKMNGDADEGEWCLVKTNKKARDLRKHDSYRSSILPPASTLVITSRKAVDTLQSPPAKENSELDVSDTTEAHLPRSRTSTTYSGDQATPKPFSHTVNNVVDCELDMDLSIELDEALISALTAEDELNNELREELREDDSIGVPDEQDYTDDQSDSWLSGSVSDSIRIPGRSVELHEKLLSPARRSKTEKAFSEENGRSSLAEQLAEKQLKVTEMRERRQRDKIERCALLSKRVEEVRAWKNELLQEKKRTIESKMAAAEQRRLSQLQQIVKKAHDEETKGSEIAFINNIEAESRKQEVQAKYQLWRKRLLELSDEQTKRREATAARKSAASDRKRALDAERQHRMQELLEKQKQRERKAEERQVEKYEERRKENIKREREHEERMAQLRIADEERKQELRERIYHKQQNVQARHSELIEQRRERAVALAMQSASGQSPRLAQNSQPTQSPLIIDLRKFCTCCSVVLDSDVLLLEHLRSKPHRQSCGLQKNASNICLQSLLTTVPLSVTQQLQLSGSLNHDHKMNIFRSDVTKADSHQMIRKKRSKKYRQRLNETIVREDFANLAFILEHGRLRNIIAELDRVVSSTLNSSQILAVERLLLEMTKIVDKQLSKDKSEFSLKFSAANGFTVLCKLFGKYHQMHDNSSATEKALAVKKGPPASNSDRFFDIILDCFASTWRLDYASASQIICYHAPLVSTVADILIHEIEGLSETAVSTLRLSGPQPISDQMRLVSIVKWFVSIFTALTKCLQSAVPEAGTDSVVQKNHFKELSRRCLDCVGLLVASDFVDKTAQIIAVATYLTEFDESVCMLLKTLASLLSALCCLLTTCLQGSELDKFDEALAFMAALRFTDLSGIFSLVYALMLKETGFGKTNELIPIQRPTDIPKNAAELALEAFRFLTRASILYPSLIQVTLAGDSSLLLQFRQACAYLLSQASTQNLSAVHFDLIDQVIVSVGLLSVLNHPFADSILSSGQPPTILQQLCQLPIKYFTDPKMASVLLPTLLAATYRCDSCLDTAKSELSPHLLLQFLQEQVSVPATPTTSSDYWVPPFRARFPERLWKEALEWLSLTSSKKDKPTDRY